MAAGPAAQGARTRQRARLANSLGLVSAPGDDQVKVTGIRLRIRSGAPVRIPGLGFGIFDAAIALHGSCIASALPSWVGKRHALKQADHAPAHLRLRRGRLSGGPGRTLSRGSHARSWDEGELYGVVTLV